MSIHLRTTEITSSEDVWKIFWSDDPKVEDYHCPGQQAFILSDFIDTLRKLGLDRRLEHPDRRYYICCLNAGHEVQAVVAQDRLLAVGAALLTHPTARYRHDLVVQYLGMVTC